MLIEERELTDERVQEIKWCSAAMYTGNLSKANFRLLLTLKLNQVVQIRYGSWLWHISHCF
jgi:hypothetical protein